jgi:Acetoacetate decarboxylase (ADC)
MTTPTIEPGLKGTLPPEEYTTKTMPHWGQTYLTIASYWDVDFVAIAFATDADKAAALIPKELELIKIPALPGQAAANLVFAKYRECDLGPYMEVIISISVLHKGRAYGYIPAIYVDNDAALLAGRELGGYPKKMAQITMRNYGNLFLSQMSAAQYRRKPQIPTSAISPRPTHQGRGAVIGAAPCGQDDSTAASVRPAPSAAPGDRQANHRSTSCRR